MSGDKWRYAIGEFLWSPSHRTASRRDALSRRSRNSKRKGSLGICRTHTLGWRTIRGYFLICKLSHRHQGWTAIYAAVFLCVIGPDANRWVF